jgi:hypothetical protein
MGGIDDFIEGMGYGFGLYKDPQTAVETPGMIASRKKVDGLKRLSIENANFCIIYPNPLDSKDVGESEQGKKIIIETVLRNAFVNAKMMLGHQSYQQFVDVNPSNTYADYLREKDLADLNQGIFDSLLYQMVESDMIVTSVEALQVVANRLLTNFDTRLLAKQKTKDLRNQASLDANSNTSEALEVGGRVKVFGDKLNWSGSNPGSIELTNEGKRQIVEHVSRMDLTKIQEEIDRLEYEFTLASEKETAVPENQTFLLERLRLLSKYLTPVTDVTVLDILEGAGADLARRKNETPNENEAKLGKIDQLLAQGYVQLNGPDHNGNKTTVLQKESRPALVFDQSGNQIGVLVTKKQCD